MTLDFRGLGAIDIFVLSSDTDVPGVVYRTIVSAIYFMLSNARHNIAKPLLGTTRLYDQQQYCVPWSRTWVSAHSMTLCNLSAYIILQKLWQPVHVPQ